MSNTESIGKRIKRLRKERGMTQEELANAVGVSPQAVSKWENDYSCPDISILPSLAKVLSVSTDELLGTEAPESVSGEFVEDPDGEKTDLEYSGRKKKKKTRISTGFGQISINKLWWSIFIILVGVVLILKNATIPWGFWDIIWPSAVICFGMSGICRRPKVFNVSVTVIGVYLLLCNTNVIPPSFSGKWFIIGVLFIICGISAFFPKRRHFINITKRGRNGGIARELRCENGYINYEGAFCEDNVSFDGGTLHGGSIETLFGSYTVDLTPLTMVGEGAQLNVDVAFSGLTVLLPRTVRIAEVRDTAFGSVNIKGSAYSDAPYVLLINSDVSFGSLDIRYV